MFSAFIMLRLHFNNQSSLTPLILCYPTLRVKWDSSESDPIGFN